MSNKSITIAVSVLLAVVILFLSGVWLASVDARKTVDEKMKSLETYDLRESGTLMKYVYHASISVPESGLEEISNVSDFQNDNFEITIDCDGSVIGVHNVTERDMAFSGTAPVFTSWLNAEDMKTLRNGIENSLAKKISYFKNTYSYNENYYYADNFSDDTVIYIAEKDRTLRVGKDDSNLVILNNYNFFRSDDSIDPLFELVEELLSEEITNFTKKIRTYNHQDHDGIYDFSTYGNNYNTNRYSNGVSMMRYYEKLCKTDNPANQRYCAVVILESNGIVSNSGTYFETDKAGVERYNEVRNKTKSVITDEEVKELEQAVKDSDFLTYASEIETGYEPDLSGVVGEYKTVKFFTVSVNHRTYSAIDDGTNPKLTSLIDKYLEITTEGVKADEAYRTSREEWQDQ